MIKLSKFSKIFFLCILCVYGFYGCEDTSSSSSGNNEQCTASSCGAEEYCGSQGKCLERVSKGGSCDDVILCKSDLVCESGVCKERVSQKCVEGGSDCGDDHYCSGGECLAKKTLGEKCDNSQPCVGKLVCIENVCEEKHKGGQSCSVHEQCEKGNFCKDGICVKGTKVGDVCEAEEDSCDDGSICLGGICRLDSGVGEPCNVDVNCRLEQTSCVEGVCIHYGTEGETCDDKYRACAEGYVCHQGECKKKPIVGEACGEGLVSCAEGLICYLGKCLERRGDMVCKSDSDCQSDSYCCTESSCSEIRGMCIPYGQGPRGNHNEACSYKTVIGQFEADVQCEWSGPEAGDPYPDHKNILMAPIVVDTPYDSGSSKEIIFTSYNCTDGDEKSFHGASSGCYGVIRIINGQSCKLHANIYDPNYHFSGASSIAAADVYKNGKIQLFFGVGKKNAKGEERGGVASYKWNDNEKKYVFDWHSGMDSLYPQSVVDVNNDGVPEVVASYGFVFSALDGKILNPGNKVSTYFSVLGKISQQEKAELLATDGVYQWDSKGKWIRVLELALGGGNYAYADFGTANKDGSFDYTKKDGIAELVRGGGNGAKVVTLGGKVLFEIGGYDGGGPVTVSDFNGDGMPEIGVAFRKQYVVFDPKCTKGKAGCSSVKDGVLWEKESQDLSSSSTGSSVFDFEGDGQSEVIYADECYTRVYEGKTGNVLFSSYHKSCTWYEYPIVADVDGDGNAEIVVGSNMNCSIQCPEIDPIHEGVRCKSNGDCISGKCGSDGYCVCNPANKHKDCNTNHVNDNHLALEYMCVDAIAPGKGKRCRASHPKNAVNTGVRVLRDRLDRWASSRPIWNQFSYNITNVDDKGVVPKTSDWKQNYLQSGMNNFRQNAQGSVGVDKAPDITGILDKKDLCDKNEHGKTILKAKVCNRGSKMVASKMPATFYMGEVKRENILCTSYTAGHVPVGDCMEVSCELKKNAQGVVILVVNDDGKGGKTTVECKEDNNQDRIEIEACRIN